MQKENLVFNRNLCFASISEYLIHLYPWEILLFFSSFFSFHRWTSFEIEWEFEWNERKCWYFQYFAVDGNVCCYFQFSFDYILQILLDTHTHTRSANVFMAENLVFHSIIREWSSVVVGFFILFSLFMSFTLYFSVQFFVCVYRMRYDAMDFIIKQQQPSTFDGCEFQSISIFTICVWYFFSPFLFRFICSAYVHILYALYVPNATCVEFINLD